MIAPKPFKYKCQKCGYSKVVKPKSDVLNPIDFISTCPKCNNQMDKIELDFLSKIINSMIK